MDVVTNIEVEDKGGWKWNGMKWDETRMGEGGGVSQNNTQHKQLHQKKERKNLRVPFFNLYKLYQGKEQIN